MSNEMELRAENDRRERLRFPIRRELRYKVMKERHVVEAGQGESLDIGSGGVSFLTGRMLKPGDFVEVSISWPALLDNSCPMRLVVFGRVLRSDGERSACTIDKYEFRTQGLAVIRSVPLRTDAMLQRWAGAVQKENLRVVAAAAGI